MGESSGRTQSHSHASNERVPRPSSQEIIPSEPASQIVWPEVYSPMQRELSLGSDGKNISEEESEIDSDGSNPSLNQKTYLGNLTPAPKQTMSPMRMRETERRAKRTVLAPRMK